jgi:hypothetical protein
MEPDEALDLAEEILTDLDDLPERAEDFKESVLEKVTGMKDWIEEHQAVTEKMATALQNIRAGVDKWLP